MGPKASIAQIGIWSPELFSGRYESIRLSASDAQRNEPPVAGTPSKSIVSTLYPSSFSALFTRT